ncbi:HdeD family acid-resistance protein [Leifsonia sp. 22587]|uniref:HdeD family acid-resistance protein n=1 Tax=Leifsonia sp. 22587 TaxID=3453946 RepID=UPI003F86B1D2
MSTLLNPIVSPIETLARRVGSLWWTVVLVGIAWIVVGFVVLRFDQSTVDVVSVVFGIMVLLAALGEFFRAFVTPGGWRVWHIVFGVFLVVGAVVAFINPGDTFASLAVITGAYFVVIGTVDIITGLLSAGIPGGWLMLVSGVAELVLGFLASSSFESSAVVLVTVVSVTAIFRGVSEIVAGFAVRAASVAARPVAR